MTALERYEIDNEQSHQSPSQVFGVGTKGEVLGVDYDLCNWVWHIPEAKDLRLRNEIWNGIEKGESFSYVVISHTHIQTNTTTNTNEVNHCL